MLRAVIFDIDNTLYDFDAVHAMAYDATAHFACNALGLERAAFDAAVKRAVAELVDHCGKNSSAVHSRRLRFQLMLEHMGRPIGLANVLDDMYWSALISQMRPYPGEREAIAALRDMGLTIGIGTNMTADRQIDKLEKLNLIDLVDFMVSSEEAGAEKPDARFFALCARKAGCEADACAFVGDHPQGDMAGARNAGMRAVWYCPKAAPDAALEGTVRIREFKELPALITAM